MPNTIETVLFIDKELRLIDQRKIPNTFEYYYCRDYRQVEFAIKDMVVRGAPAIGDAAGYGVVLAAKEFLSLNSDEFKKKTLEACDCLQASRPTAVNLTWALARMRKIIAAGGTNQSIATRIRQEADTILKEDIETSIMISKNGAKLVPQGATILTHCNTGALAVSGYGTALGVIRQAHYEGKDIFVYADETRPRLQGGRLTAWELLQEKIPAKLIVDGAAATLIRDGKIDLIVVGADRIAANGDTANKIGTFMLSALAKVYDVPFYIAAPISTLDRGTASGKGILIEERAKEEITQMEGLQIAPVGIDVYNPAFDVTPWENITGIITEKGVLRPPYQEQIKRVVEEKG
ncbi:S-methyl-5-thioribose-1-phosphate isomerase [Clostridia bacterium]|nr:S-methyl-5-thioribose-1-phosphate isomerase [Clostridia bacterium]